MKLSKKQVNDASKKAESLVSDINLEYQKYAYSIIFSQLLGLNNDKNITESTAQVETKKTKPNNSKIKKGPKSQLLELVDDSFFKKQRSIVDMIKELEKRNYHYKQTDLTKPLSSLVREKILRREKKKIDNKQLWHYSNW